MTYRHAVSEGIARSMRADDRVVLLGEDVAAAGGVFKTTKGLLDEFGPVRVRDTPIAEQAIVGTAMGAAMTGLRPIADLMFADFAAVCFDGLVNQLPKARYMSGGQLAVPVVIRAAQGGGLGFGAQHSQCVEGWLSGIPGLKVVAPSTPADVVGLMHEAVADPDPVVFLEHKTLFDVKGDVPDDHFTVRIGEARHARDGDDVSVLCLSGTVSPALAAAETLAGQGIEADVLDLRTLAPLDWDAISSSVMRTSSVVVVEESPPAAGWGGAVLGRIAAELFFHLDRPPLHIAGAPVPVPYARSLESVALPGADHVARTIMAWARG